MLELLATMGPGIVFLLAFLETVFITGLVMPTGPAVIVTTALAVDGRFPLASVAGAALAGGALGDTGGFWIGRRVGPRVLEGDSFFARRARRFLPRAVELAGRHPVLGVTFARLVSFVRTLSPQLAGMSHITYLRFLAYDLVGVAAWAALYLTVGLLAREGWEEASRLAGTTGAVAFALLLGIAWLLLRLRGGVSDPDRRGPAADGDHGC